MTLITQRNCKKQRKHSTTQSFSAPYIFTPINLLKKSIIMRLLASTTTRTATIWCLLASSLLFGFVSADIVVENDLIDPKDIYDVVVQQDSKHWWMSTNVTKYYCVMRGLWNPQNHPAEFPQLARFSNPLMYSSTKQFLPWLPKRATTYGVEKIAEVRNNAWYQHTLAFLLETATSANSHVSSSFLLLVTLIF